MKMVQIVDKKLVYVVRENNYIFRMYKKNLPLY